MKYIILLLLAKIMLVATSPQEINFEQTDDYHKAQFSGNFKMVDYYKGKLYICYRDKNAHYIASFNKDLKLYEAKSKNSKASNINFLISNDKKTYSINIFTTKSHMEITDHGYNEQNDDLVPVEHKIYRWNDGVKIFDGTYNSSLKVIMNSDYNYLYDFISSNYKKVELKGGEFAGEYTSHTYTTEYISKNSENNLYIFSEYFYKNKFYYFYHGGGGSESNEYCLINATLKQNVANSVKLCDYIFDEQQYDPPSKGKYIKSPLFSPDEKYFVGRIYTYPDYYVLKSEPTDTLLIYELPVTKEPKYVKFDSLSNVKCFTPNATSLLMVLNNHIYNFDLFSGKEISKMDFDFDDEIVNMDVSPENNTLAVITYNSYSGIINIYIFDYENYFSQIASYEENENNQIKISPNPASEYIEISIDVAQLEGEHHLNIEIYDVLGEFVSNVSTSVPSGHLRQRRTIRVDVSTLPKGVYFVKIGNNVEKFVKM